MEDSSYFDLERPEDGPEKTSYFVLDSLLRSRIECGFESNSNRYDENVNVYLVHLLSGLVGSAQVSAHTAERDIDIFEKIRECADPRFKCQVYRTNADHLLISTGIFTDCPYVEQGGQRFYQEPTRDRIGRGKAYYHYASALHDRIQGASPVLARVLQHLSEDFERYVDVLFHMRGEYFNLYQRLTETQLMALQQDLSASSFEGQGATDLSSLRDEFLDAYWLWHQNPDASARNTLIESVKRLRAADPTFNFQLPEK